MKAEFTMTGYNKDSDKLNKDGEALIDITKMSKAEKLSLLDELVMDNYIEIMQTGQLKANDLGAVVTYLKNNKVVQEKKAEETEADIIDDIIKEIK